jgi:glycosyltransferase involved in cell wall biosynthesis
MNPPGTARRILIVTNCYPPNFMGGAELVAHEQARKLLERGFEILVFAGDFNGPGDRHSMRFDNFETVPVYRVKTTTKDYDPSYVNFVHERIEKKFSKVLADFRPDIVHCHNIIGLSARLPILANEFGASVVCTLHDHWGYCLRNTAVRRDDQPCHDISLCRDCLPKSEVPIRLRKDMIAFALDRVSLFVVPSEFLAQSYVSAGFPRDRIRVVRNGIDVGRFVAGHDRPKEERLSLAYVGHFGTHKGVEVLIRSLSMTKLSNYHLSIIGQGPNEEIYRNMIEYFELKDRVSIIGHVDHSDMPDIYARTDALVLPSIWGENQPVCIMEAMASEVTVVASRIGGIPELIDDGVSGLLCEAGNAAEFAAAIDRLLCDPLLGSGMAGEGRRFAESISIGRQIDMMIDVYDESIQSGTALPRDKKLIALTGEFRGKWTGLSLVFLWIHRNAGSYLVPSDWLTARQKRTAKPRQIWSKFGWGPRKSRKRRRLDPD